MGEESEKDDLSLNRSNDVCPAENSAYRVEEERH
jgi:hypothetical protein